MHIEAYGTTDRGQVRQSNEDAFFIDESHQLYAVADGLGGLPGGAEASQRTVELINMALEQAGTATTPFDWKSVIGGIHQKVTDESFDAHPFTGSGSTLTVAHITGDQLTIAHVGDSAAYLLRGGHLEKLTLDHTMEQEWIAQRGEAARAAMPPEMSHTLTRCIGQNDELQVDQTVHRLKSGDRVLLCTDGLNKVLPEATIEEALRNAATPEDSCKELTELANQSAGPDNITIIVLQVC
ncbi:MAG: SpoIIE family protein phosphatase [Verrucomicrobia bacterium]|jgi:protein phosphatase|nr:SpoIIE family protein phosphatase [Verrucomicrobiota bacterium]